MHGRNRWTRYGSYRMLREHQRRQNDRRSNDCTDIFEERTATDAIHILALHTSGGSRSLNISLIPEWHQFLSAENRSSPDISARPSSLVERFIQESK